MSNNLQQQLKKLDDKLGVLHEAIEALSLEVHSLSCHHDEAPTSDIDPNAINVIAEPTFEGNLLHKDILNESGYKHNPKDFEYSMQVSSDIQITRLTAQLTAAYNRIAALEEQLLSKRIRV
jgi:hypothetical protein